MEQTPMITLVVNVGDKAQRNALQAFLTVLDGGTSNGPVISSEPNTTSVKTEKAAAANTRKPMETPKEKPAPAPKDEDNELTLDDLTSKVRSIAEGNPEFTKGLKGLLKPYGVDRVSNLDPTDWAKFYAELSAY